MSKYKAVKTNGFDSGLEDRFHTMLLKSGIEFEKQIKFELQESFKINGKSIQSINYIADFYLKKLDIIIDVKGFETADFKIKKKMFQKKFNKDIVCLAECPKIYEIENKNRLFEGWIDISLLKKLQTKRKKEDEKLGKVRKKRKKRSKI